MAKTVQKNITLPLPILHDLELKAGKSGLSVSEYIRILIFNDTKNIREKVWEMSPEQERAVSESLEAYKNGDYVELDTQAKKKAFVKGKLNG
ncbi:MAG: hypothetical protein ACE5DX_05515 [Candidatus Dojkabacteria bacterium]